MNREPARPSVAGHNRITTEALISTARAVAAETFGVDPERVRAFFSDDRGLLALRLALPLPVPSLARVLEEPGVVDSYGGALRDRAERSRSPILHRVQQLTGAQLSRVDVRIVGSTVTPGVRVR